MLALLFYPANDCFLSLSLFLHITFYCFLSWLKRMHPSERLIHQIALQIFWEPGHGLKLSGPTFEKLRVRQQLLKIVCCPVPASSAMSIIKKAMHISVYWVLSRSRLFGNALLTVVPAGKALLSTHEPLSPVLVRTETFTEWDSGGKNITMKRVILIILSL